MKKTIFIILLVISVLITGCQKESLSDSEIEGNPFSSEFIDNEEVAFAYGFGVSNPPATTDIIYDGNPISITCYIDNLSAQLSAGLLIFVDGEPQPFSTSENSKISYMHTCNAPEKTKVYIDITFTPIKGAVGDTLSIRFISILNPHNKPTGLNYQFGHTNAMNTFFPRYIKILHAPPENITVETRELKKRALSSNELKKLQYTDSRGQYINRLEQFNFQIQNPSNSEVRYLENTQGSITFKITAFGGLTTEYRVIPYINHIPLFSNDMANSIFVEPGNNIYEDIVTLETKSLDKSHYNIQDYNVFYVLAVPVDGNTQLDPFISSSFVF